jgi:hypothetical protein
VAGVISLGLVWGWLLALVTRRGHISLSALVKLIGATVTMSIEVEAFSGTVGLITFVIATGAAWLLHMGWMQELKRRLRTHG